MKSCRGFTLIEILVVIVVISLLAGIAVLAIGKNPQQQLKQEAQRLQALLELAADRALLESREYGLHLEPHAYQITLYDEDKQQWAAASQEAFAHYKLPDDMRLTLISEGTAVNLAYLNQEDDEAAFNSARNVQQGGLNPALLLLSSGENTPFKLQFHDSNKTSWVSLSSDGLGLMSIESHHDA